jgi:hypothetical protein
MGKMKATHNINTKATTHISQIPSKNKESMVIKMKKNMKVPNQKHIMGNKAFLLQTRMLLKSLSDTMLARKHENTFFFLFFLHHDTLLPLNSQILFVFNY